MVEFVPVRKSFIALAVDDKVPSSSKDTTWAIPILYDEVEWYPDVSKNYSLSWTVIESPDDKAV